MSNEVLEIKVSILKENLANLNALTSHRKALAMLKKIQLGLNNETARKINAGRISHRESLVKKYEVFKEFVGEHEAEISRYVKVYKTSKYVMSKSGHQIIFVKEK